MTRTASLAMKMAMLLFVSATSFGQAPPELQAKLNAKIKHLEAFSTDLQVVSAVKTYNSTTPSPETKVMTNEKWHSLTLFDPFIRAVGKNALSEYLKTRRDDEITKIFVSGADGGKVGFSYRGGSTRSHPEHGS